MIDFSNFVQLDPRKDRATVTVTEESLYNRCEVMLPPELIKNKDVLDVGSALGAMGHWVLEHGANLYDGVEIQAGYRQKSNELLSKYPNAKIFRYLGNTSDQYDVVIAAGVIHGSLDLVGLLRKICSKSREYVIIETHLKEGSTPSIEISIGNMINYNDVNKPFTGVQLFPNIAAVNILMNVNGFELDKRLYPKPFTKSHDAYNTITGSDRFIARYKRTNKKLLTLEDAIHVAV